MSLELIKLPAGTTDGHYWINPEAIASIYVASDGIITLCMRDGLDIDVRFGSAAGRIVERIIEHARADSKYSVKLDGDSE